MRGERGAMRTAGSSSDLNSMAPASSRLHWPWRRHGVHEGALERIEEGREGMGKRLEAQGSGMRQAICATAECRAQAVDPPPKEDELIKNVYERQ